MEKKQQYNQFYKNTNEQRKKRRQQSKKSQVHDVKMKIFTMAVFGMASLLILFAIGFCMWHFYLQWKGEVVIEDLTSASIEPIVGAAEVFPDLPITEDFLTVNRYSRPGLPLTSAPQYIVIHYTANPGSTAKQNRDYFEGLKDSGETFASAQFVIGLSGEIIQCVPCNEMAYCSNELNEMCISIEMCHPDETGNFKDETYNNCVYLVAQLMNYYGLDMDQLIRHYDVTGKNCPKYFVEHDDRWEVFKGFVEEYRERYRHKK